MQSSSVKKNYPKMGRLVSHEADIRFGIRVALFIKTLKDGG